MHYIDINTYSRKWIFTHASMPVPAEDLVQIKPLSQARSATLWREHISSQSPDSDHFGKGDWAGEDKNWTETVEWQAAWDDDEPALPEVLADFLDWEDNTPVYFCYEKYNLIETSWGVFKRNWKNFLFFDDGPLLIARKKTQAVWFHSNGTCKIGHRSA
ncbi:DUF2947 domain-containing protein [Photobacterium sp. 2_MG-2023]|uniref:DUF2947 domain-containing protein n=1 Tax=Photobacterium arenosum TaxID=2774143 RepID=A0ABR9BHW1_9GAMM|nr:MULTISPECIES: DUF2947 domain-containing protein [Photobacterium]MBD8512155.1 DUF2947 domain-containing protein [Photobacterium arenosum]MDO6581226.1 DUF2947 domain-containing protein [Photobacterium sp. 2_MG-2023]